VAKKQIKIVKVEWFDACSQEGQISIDEIDTAKYVIETCGFLAQKTKKYISLAQGYKKDWEQFRQLIHIPMVNVLKITEMKASK